MDDKGVSVLEQYDFKVANIRRGRGNLICYTDQGIKLLEEFHGSKRHLSAQNKLLNSMIETGYPYLDTIVQNKSGAYISVNRDEVPYLVKNWFEGRECDARNKNDILEAVKNLARIHQHMTMPEEFGEGEYGIGENLAQEYIRHNRELKKIYSFTRKKKKKNDFELVFLKNFQTFFSQGEESLRKLNETNYEELYQRALSKRQVCHGEYNHHNILFLEQGIATTNFGKCEVNMQIGDLYQFMRKILEKHNWSITLGRAMLLAYESICPLSREEKENLFIRLSYPEKFWKIANHYYYNNKAWISAKNVEKLNNFSAQYQMRENFIAGVR